MPFGWKTLQSSEDKLQSSIVIVTETKQTGGKEFVKKEPNGQDNNKQK